MRKGRDGEKRKKRGEKGEKTDDYSGHYVISSSRPPKRRPLERRTLMPINYIHNLFGQKLAKYGLLVKIAKLCPCFKSNSIWLS